MKKALSLLLAILMIAVGVVPAMAMETDEIHEIFSVSDEELFSDTFGVSASTYSVNNVSNNGVIYDYNVTLEEDGTYSASMEFDVVINGTANRANASGTLDKVELDDGSVYLSGPLDGSIEVGNKEYKIIVGFQTEYGSKEISAGITLENENLLHFAFGKYEMPDEIFEKNYSTISAAEYNESMTLNNNYVSQDSIQANFSTISTISRTSNYSPSIVHILKVYYSPTGNFLAATVSSNSDVFLTDSFYSTSKVYQTKTTFEHIYSGLSHSYIERVVKGPDENNSDVSLSNLFSFLGLVYKAIQNATGITLPLDSVVETLISNGGGGSYTRKYEDGRTRCIITTRPSTSYDINKPNQQVPLTLVLHCACNDTPANYNYKVSSELRYVCTHIKEIYYIDAFDAITNTFSIPID